MTALAVLMPGFTGTTLPAWLEARLRDGLGGVCLFAENVESPEQLIALTDAIYAANPRAIISMDEEGGDVSRLYQAQGSPFPGNAILGRLDDAALTERVGAQVGAELAAMGVGLALAPDADVNCNPHNPVIGVRSFGADAHAVARHVAAWTRGIEATGVASCAKHFPGHGDTAQDSHLALPVIDADAATIRARELVPFRAAIEAGARTVMTSHLMVPALDPERPATFSSIILRDLLRGELGFDGVVVTDALDMAGASAELGIPGAAVASLAAGSDLLCIGTRNTDEQIAQIAAAIDAAVLAGTLTSAMVNEAAARVLALGEQIARPARPASGETGAVPGLTVADVARAFHVSDAAKALLAASPGRPLAWVALESAPNIAVGQTPWGPWADGVVPVASTSPTGRMSALPGTEAPDPSAVWGAALNAEFERGSLIIAVGKDLHRHPFNADAIASLRERGDVLAVDMGWPAPDFAGVDIATFGASRIAGRALRKLVEGDR